MHKRFQQRSLLDVLHRVNRWHHFTKHFGPISGASTKISEPEAHYLLTIFGYGCNIGPTETEKHSSYPISRRSIARINMQHINVENLQKAIDELNDQCHSYPITEIWGSPNTAVADGTHIPLRENNLLGEHHFRYGRYGGIAYHHIADTYVAVFSHFITCGVWEAVYILDGLMAQKSRLNFNKIHADSQGQNEPAFGLSFLLGIELMPRIRQWKDLNLYKANPQDNYRHIETLFSKKPINWTLIQTHWKELMQVVISIQSGKVLPSFILHKLGRHGKKTTLYKVFAELGRAVRTIYLLDYMYDQKLQQQITASTNKIESFNSFCDWITFGSEAILTGDPIEQQKRVRYTTLIANAIMLHNSNELTTIIQDLEKEHPEINKELIACLSPYQREHIRKFGDFVLNEDQEVESIIVDKSILGIG